MSDTDVAQEDLSFFETEQPVNDDEMSILVASILDEEMYGINWLEIMQDECPDRYSVSEESSSLSECTDLNWSSPVEDVCVLPVKPQEEHPVKICRHCNGSIPLPILISSIPPRSTSQEKSVTVCLSKHLSWQALHYTKRIPVLASRNRKTLRK
jgi:hypothetical protein